MLQRVPINEKAERSSLRNLNLECAEQQVARQREKEGAFLTGK